MPAFRPQIHISALFLAVAVILTASTCSIAADWPQWRGPDRDGLSQEEGLLQDWPADGPPLKWLFKDCGLGYGGPAIVGDRLYIMGSRDETEQLLALDIANGEELWAVDLGEEYENGWGNGPRGTPTVDSGAVYALGAQGTLKCIDAKSGEVRWSKTMQEFGGGLPNWGFSESPLVLEDSVICTPGGKQGAIVALDKNSGELLWQTEGLDSQAHYSSLVKFPHNGKLQVVQLLVDKLVGIDSENGEVLWETPWQGRTAVIPTPIVRDNMIYVTSGYGVGCMLVTIDDDNQVDIKYENKNMKNHHGGVILLGEHLYGHSDPVGWLCQDLLSGETVWREREALGKGAIGYADNRFYCLDKDTGTVALIAASPEGWEEHGRFTLSPQTELRKDRGKIWMHPVIVDGKLYLRDQDLLFCFDVTDSQ